MAGILEIHLAKVGSALFPISGENGIQVSGRRNEIADRYRLAPV